LSVAASSIGIGGLILLTIFRLIYKRDDVKIDKILLILFGIFVLVQLVSGILCNDPADSFDNMYRKTTLYIIFFASILFIQSFSRLKKLLLALFLFSAFVSSVELARFAVDYLPNQVKPLSEYRLEYFGFPLTNGAIKMMILLIIIPFIFLKKDYILKKIYLVLLSLPIMVTFYLTNARNAILGLFAGLVIYGLLKNRYLLGGLILLTGLFLLFAPLPMKERMLSIADINHPSNHARIVMWETGIKIFKDNPVLGVGDVDINKVYRQYKSVEFHGEGSHMHSNFFQILVNFGIIGLVSWLALMLYILFRQIRTYLSSRDSESVNVLAAISICSMAALMVSGLTEWNFGDAEFAAIMWFNLSLAFIAARFTERSNIGNS
jgi:O-antigen ligase